MHWKNALTSFLNLQASSQDVSGQGFFQIVPSVSGAVSGYVLGITGGIESDIDFFLHIHEIIGGLILTILNPDGQTAAMDVLLSHAFFGQSQMECQIAKATQDNYFNNVLPALYEKAPTIRASIQSNWDADDKAAFDNGFVIGYHGGFIYEQAALLDITATKAAELLKGGKFATKAEQAIAKAVEGIIGKSTVVWSSDAIRGLESFLTKGGNWEQIPFAEVDKVKIMSGIGETEKAFGQSAEHVKEFVIIVNSDDVGYISELKAIGIGENAFPDLVKNAGLPHEYGHAKIINELAGGKNAAQVVGNSNYKYVEWFDEMNADLIALSKLTDKQKYIDEIVNRFPDSGQLLDLAQTREYTKLAYIKKMGIETGNTYIANEIDSVFGVTYPGLKQDFDDVYKIFDKQDVLQDV